MSDFYARRRNAPLSNGIPPGTREINVAPMLSHAKPGVDTQTTISRAIAMAGIMVQSVLPAMVSWGMTMGLIFGGCCSNVRPTKEHRFLITFIQFAVTALFTWPTHFSWSKPPFFLRSPAVPVLRWLPNILIFFVVNLLNNFAFGYNISVPVHIILRSGGSATTMIVGWVWGKRYNKIQVFSVAMLTVGVIVAAMSDAQSKGKASTASTGTSTASFLTGLSILFLAQILSAIMGLYTQNTYATYGPHWHENLFYSHFLSLPLFLPFLPSLRQQSSRLLTSQALSLDFLPKFASSEKPHSWLETLAPSFLLPTKSSSPMYLQVPIHLVHLALNAVTQYACIRGVNLLGARTSALGVSIVLNLRKLISLFASIWLFGNHLPLGVMVGAALVFGGGGIYAWDGGGAKERDSRKEKRKGR
ncbi:MAG: hypothetical protein Q9187_000428 [Circinaria calcarea]